MQIQFASSQTFYIIKMVLCTYEELKIYEMMKGR